jgi:hypothetical protein
MSRKPTLFYSKKCPHCAEVLNKIRMAPAAFGSSFEYIIIDGNRNLPSFLKEVPTLIVPTHPQPITGDAVFMWIDTQVRMSAQQQRGPPQQQSQPQLSNTNQKKVEGAILNHMDGLSFYNAMEMSGFGDNYLSLEDENGGQEHCFVFIDDKGNKQVQCVPANSNTPSYNPNQFNQQSPQQQVPDWLKSETVGRNNEQKSVPNYNPNQNAGGSMTMSQQNNIRLQQEARGLPPMMNFQDPQRAGMNETSKLNDMDYEKYASMRDNDPRIMPPTQRI